MSDLIAFVEARLAEDEQLAKACTPGHEEWQAFPMEDVAGCSVYDDQWRLLSGTWYTHNKPMSNKPDATGPAYINTDRVMEHIARHDPARVLREVEAKRRLIAAHPRANDPDELPHCETCRYIADPDDPEPFPEAGYPCPTLRALAMVWAEHPDYRAEWRPE